MSWKLRAPRRERNRTAVGRPDRRDVERLGDGHALLPRAVVIRHVDVRDAAIAHRAADAFAVPVGREGDLGAGDAVQSALLLVYFVGDGVRIGAHRVGLDAGGAAAVLPRHRRRAARDVDQPHADQDALGCLGDAADQHGVGVQLLPAVQGHLVERGRLRDRPVRIPRNHVVLLLELQIVPDHVADDLRRRLRLRIVGQRDERRNRELRRQAGIAPVANDQAHVALPGRRRRGRRLLRRQRNRDATGKGYGDRASE